ncbi:MAG TPA: TonB-dependent receptor [Planctomycetota bacterium]|nr:TonB-dependent receptor [Planctomycetota bacterium]
MNILCAILLALQDPAPAAQAPPPPPAPPAQEKEVVVTATRRESDILDVPSAVTVVTAKDIVESGSTNIVEVVQRQPGFFAQGQNKGAYDQIVDIRGYNNGGGNGQRTLVLVDGRKTNSVTGTSTDWAAIPLDNIDRIEIVRGPAAALYGDGALAGVVNIITRKGTEDFSGSADVSGGSWDAYQGRASLGGSAGVLRYDVYLSTDGTSGWREHDLYRGDDVTGRFDFPINPTLQAFLKVGHHNDRREQPGTLSELQIQTFGPRYADPTRVGSTTAQEDYVDAGLTQQLEEFGAVSLFIDRTYRSGTLVNEQFGGVVGDDSEQVAMLQLKHVWSPKPFSDKATFTTGVDLSYETAAGESGPPGGTPDVSDYRRRLIGLYEGLQVRPIAPLTFSGGFRYDRALLTLNKVAAPTSFAFSVDTQRAFDETSPYAGVTWRILEELAAYASWGRTFKLPTRDEMIGILVTAPGLDPERATTYEAGLRFSSGTWGSAGVTFYRMNVRDELFFDADTFTEINFDRVAHEGVETEARLTPCKFFEMFGTWTLTKVTIERGLSPDQEGKTYPVTPRYAATAGVVGRYEGASLTLGGRYASRRYLINDFTNVDSTLPAYMVYTARLAYTWRALTLFASIDNLTDRKYNDSGGYGLGFGPDRFSPAPERSWQAGGEVRF